ncbi:unnamed protein product [Ostreobium quekettii]|uniref:ATP phosphoribosyltransferase n=1 Tax=Ostreobium quekettii TaxID=121088 RepID=A0A8S1IMC6_9CHLO|nr:unnamed protein product [Ostreobium quekettii]|eukprot:evm.model.scf_253EXC.5 EVM.evm.TU.scf_253EXC.5   scf_253EXC:27618-30383(+)
MVCLWHSQDCQLAVYKPNPRQYVATIPQLPGLEVWFQRASDVVRKIKTGDVDLGIVGYDMFAELAGDDEGDLIVVHDALDFGHCKLALGIPTSGAFADISTLEQLKKMPQWSESRPLRVVTGYQRIARDFFSMKGFQNVRLVSADGALEAAPAMGSADIILDLVSTGVTLRENNLKEIEGGKVLESQGILVANRQSLKERPGLLEVTRELIERFEAHLVADGYYSVIANMHGDSMEDVAHKLNSAEDLGGLEGPTISPVYAGRGSKGAVADGPRAFAAVICIKKKELYRCVKELRKVGGRDVLVQPMTYIFDAEPERWRILQENLGLMGRC